VISLEQAAELLERQIRDNQAPAPNLLADSFPEQIAFVQDTAPLKCAFTTRRAAKSFSAGLDFVQDSFTHPYAHYLLLMTVRAQAKRDFWQDVLKPIERKHELGMKFNETELTATFQNGAIIYVGGADSSHDEWRKLLAGKYRKVQIDEAQGFIHADLSTLVYETFKPSVTDWRGSVALSGTPGIVAKGLFYNVTQGLESGWSLHTWDTHKNTVIGPTGKRICDEWAAEIADLKARKPGVEKSNWFRRNYMREWVVEEDARVYRYQAMRNDFSGELPLFTSGGWHHVLAVDLGWHGTAFTLLAYHDHSRTLYVLESRKKTGLDITATSAEIRRYERQYEIESYQVDGANKQAVAEMNARHGLALEAADKRDKFEFIELMNDDFAQGLIKLSPECKPLKEEYAKLVIDERHFALTGIRREQRGLPNHCCDATLYGWRKAYTYLATKAPPVPKRIGTFEFQQALARAQIAMADEGLDRLLRRNADELGVQPRGMDDEDWAFTGEA